MLADMRRIFHAGADYANDNLPFLLCRLHIHSPHSLIVSPIRRGFDSRCTRQKANLCKAGTNEELHYSLWRLFTENRFPPVRIVYLRMEIETKCVCLKSAQPRRWAFDPRKLNAKAYRAATFGSCLFRVLMNFPVDRWLNCAKLSKANGFRVEDVCGKYFTF